MKLQLALDSDFDSGIGLLRRARPYIDVVEIGTPLIFHEGVAAVRAVRRMFPELTLLADLKIMDAGALEAAIALEAGADIVTVLALAQDATVRAVLDAAHRAGKHVMADMLQVPDPVARARTLLDMGCDYLCVHNSADIAPTPGAGLGHLERLRTAFPDAPLVIAGGITVDDIAAIAPLRPEIVVVGGAIARAGDPGEAARRFRERMNAP